MVITQYVTRFRDGISTRTTITTEEKMDIISRKVQQRWVASIMEMAVLIERTMGRSFIMPQEYIDSGMCKDVEKDPLFVGFLEQPHYKDFFPVQGLVFLRYYALGVVENMLRYPGSTKVDLNGYKDMWNYDYVEALKKHRKEVARQIESLRIQTAMLPKTQEVMRVHYHTLTALTKAYDDIPANVLNLKHAFDDRIDRLLVEFKFPIQSFVGDNPWVIHNVRFHGQDIIIEKMEDYRILEWSVLHENGALDVAREQYIKDKEAN